MNPFRTFDRLGWLAVALAVLALAIGTWWILTEPGRQRARAIEAQTGQVLADGRREAATDAISVITGSHDRDASIDLQTQENANAIRNAPGADVPHDPGLDSATRRAICMRASARTDPACVALLHPRSH